MEVVAELGRPSSDGWLFGVCVFATTADCGRRTTNNQHMSSPRDSQELLPVLLDQHATQLSHLCGEQSRDQTLLVREVSVICVQQ
jgi:hypothetical protein